MSRKYEFFPELDEIYKCARNLNGVGSFKEEYWIHYEGLKFPLTSFRFGNSDPEVAKLVIIGGIHGLEKIGTHVVTSYLQTIIRLLQWDKSIRKSLEKCELIFYPLANPVGMMNNTRSNGNGVDLMRNAPISARSLRVPLIGGHRISPSLPWFRGYKAGAMEEETQFLCKFIKENCYSSKLTVALDVHSGFGLVDRLWFPYAYSDQIFPEAHKMLALKELMDRSYPQHIYRLEPQNLHYLAHGDIWDFLYLEQRRQRPDNIFLPLCLEMGSWHWVRKNPKQLFSAMGIYNPILPHRLKRTQRRHLVLFEFLRKAIRSPRAWAELRPGEIRYLQEQAIKTWYKDQAKPTISFKN